ncbi:unnamed protein product [[Candida] boidinii]|uniref:Cytochrome c oxidase subunit 13, mitochondrial n=1 Tax=Candida boidinii TaxID=5477 RepID=A0A9W6T6Z2_CANBO|nr:hypothetical protein BVG19_g512 [[Candida] boidinii]OWB48515.1 hypothetical protein B5S27_g50 [[Candida] boidinii]OWB69097.1 hypothetical protein B5S30_g4495 [[Candida] boidinii]OWB82350.1 hypothetical protein B5S33_g974 [[Candida] boidinii]GME79588.1 unnamed protein product [[Candida] boidinii]
MFRQLVSKQIRANGKRFSSTLDGPAFKPADAAKAKAFKEHALALDAHSAKTAGLWKKISFVVALPIIGITAVNTYFVEAEHAEHRAHTKHLSDEEWPTQYPYQNIRRVNYFWGDGDKTLFWNPDCNRHIREY